jgi:hypothetical protein
MHAGIERIVSQVVKTTEKLGGDLKEMSAEHTTS